MATFDKARIKRELEQERRQKAVAHLRDLRVQIKEARVRRRLAVRSVRDQCRTARARLKEARKKLRTRCDARAELARTAGDADIRESKRRLSEERSYQRALRGSEAAGARKRAPRSTARERAQESDDEVRRDLPPELVPIFERLKRHVKGGPRKTRTEAFLEWVEDHTEEVARLQSDADELAVRRMVAEREKLERELYGRQPRRRAAGEAPF